MARLITIFHRAATGGREPRPLVAALCIALLITVQVVAEDDAQRVGTIRDKRIDEASGIVASRQFPGIFWTHNDGDDGELYAVHRDGSLVGSAKISTSIHDWEDIAIDDGGNLYVADTGNNAQRRRQVAVHRIAEPDPASLRNDRPPRLAIAQSWNVDFPGDSANIESLSIWQKTGYLIFKQPEGVAAEIYSFALNDRRRSVMEKVATLPVDQPVTAADISADGRQLAVLARGDLWVYKIDGDIANAANADAIHFSVPPVQTEGCCFSGNEILIVAETGELFAAPLPVATTQPATTQP